MERALEHLAAVGADTTGQPVPLPPSSQNGARDRGRVSWNRSWHRRNSHGDDAARRDAPDQRRSVGRHQHLHYDESPGPGTFGATDNGWTTSIPDADRFAPGSPRTPPRPE